MERTTDRLTSQDPAATGPADPAPTAAPSRPPPEPASAGGGGSRFVTGAADLRAEEPDSLARGYLELFFRHPARELVANLDTTVQAVRSGPHLLPLTVNEAGYDNSYVCSPYTQYVRYAAAELAILGRPRWEQAAARALLGGLGAACRRAAFNRVVHVNNWLWSTNLYPSAWDGADAAALTAALVARYPDHALVFRSLNRRQNPVLLPRLEAAGYLLVGSRVVWHYEGVGFTRTPNYRRDQRALARTPLRLVGPADLRAEDAPALVRLYEQLYVEKYTPLNPRYTPAYLAACLRQGLLRCWALRDEAGGWRGVVGCFERDGVLTAPVVGYDTAAPVGWGLYRLLMAVVLGETARRGVLLNLSAGAGGFKRLRGGEPCAEWSAVYLAHLPPARRWPWQLLATLTRRIILPLIERQGL